MHREFEPASRTPNWRETTPLKCTDKSVPKENGDDANCAPFLALCTPEPSLRPQRQQVSQDATGGDEESKATRRKVSGHTTPQGSDWRPMGRDERGIHTIGKKR